MPWAAGTFNRLNGPTGWVDDANAFIGIEATRHDTQDNDFRDGINACLNKAGQNSPTADLPMGGYKHTNVAAASATTDYARYDQLLAIIPSGTIWQFAAAAAPTGWLICDGTAVSRTTYAALFAAISTTYGAGDGSTTFNVPDLRRRTPVGKGSSDSLGNSDGVAVGSRTLTHTHVVNKHYHGMGTGSTAAVDISHTHSPTAVTGTIDSGGAHTHSVNGRDNSTASNAGSFMRASATGTINNLNTASDGAHTHTFTLSTSPSLGATSKSVTGLIGLVTGGVDGNVDQATQATNNSNYLIVNYIIKT